MGERSPGADRFTGREFVRTARRSNHAESSLDGLDDGSKPGDPRAETTGSPAGRETERGPDPPTPSFRVERGKMVVGGRLPVESL